MNKAKVFVIMPFEDEFFEAYDAIKAKFNSNFEFSNAGEEDNQQNILSDIILPIYEADIILADLTGLNPNVMYELGIAHCLNKKTIIITRDDLANLPFDLKQYRTKGYSTHYSKFNELLKYLDKNFNGAVDGSVVFSNPVIDIFASNDIKLKDVFKQDKISISIEDEEKGFLDFLSDIEHNTNFLTENINSMVVELNYMNDGIKARTNEIEKVNKNPSDGNNAFIKKEVKKVAEYIRNFSKQLNSHNEQYSILWDDIEKDILGLLDNEFMIKNNENSLEEYLKSLYGLKVNIESSNDSMINMRDSINSNKGIERKLNQAIREMDESLNSYLDITEQMIASINRILKKGKSVVGSINFE